MDKDKYDNIVNLIINSDLPIPEMLIKNYEDPGSRATTARSLMMLGNYEEALELFMSINKDDVEEEENWILLLHNIGVCYMKGFKNYEKALEYLKMSLNLLEETQEEISKNYSLCVKGEIWGDILETLYILNKKEDLQKEIDQKLEYLNNCENKYRYNSYLFYLNYFLSKHETDIDKAIEYLFNALKNYELRGEFEEKKLLELWDNKKKEPNKVFEQMENLIRGDVCWDI